MEKLLIKQQLILEDLSLFPRCDPLWSVSQCCDSLLAGRRALVAYVMCLQLEGVIINCITILLTFLIRNLSVIISNAKIRCLNTSKVEQKFKISDALSAIFKKFKNKCQLSYLEK